MNLTANKDRRARAGRTGGRVASAALGAGLVVLFSMPRAEQVMVYDEEKGIIFVDKATGRPVDDRPMTTRRTTTVRETTQVEEVVRVVKKKAAEDIHTNRQKDPPELYFNSGLEYFKNKDYPNALKNFRHADSLRGDPVYKLWIGKIYRQLGEHEKMFDVMTRLIDRHPRSDVADDALFEIAFYYQVNDDFENAMITYAQLAEQYPFGVSFSNGQEFREISREQRRLMRAEMISTLKLLGCNGELLEELYRDFQKSRGLPVTGEGDQRTVRMIKQQYQQMQQKETLVTGRLYSMRKQYKWAALAGAFFLVQIAVAAGVILSLRSKRLQVAEMHKSLAVLDTHSI